MAVIRIGFFQLAISLLQFLAPDFLIFSIEFVQGLIGADPPLRERGAFR